MADMKEHLFEALLDAERRARLPENDLAQPKGEVQSFRNGLLAAYLIVTGQSIEEVGETLDNVLYAEDPYAYTWREP